MTLNQIYKTINDKLESHQMLNTVIASTPMEWLNKGAVPLYPVGSFAINSGQINQPRELVYRVDMWLLDQSGRDGEFEQNVTSEMHGVAYDILAQLRRLNNPWTVSNTISWTALSEKFEDYLSGVRISFDITLTGAYGACDTPTT